MIYTHIFLVILVTVVLIIFAEYQNLRKISWILLIGCITYILLIIEPEKAKISNNENDLFTRDDSTIMISKKSHTKEFNTVIDSSVSESINTNKLISEGSDTINDLQNLDILTISIAEDIIGKAPIGVSKLFLNDINTLYCFTAVYNSLRYNKIIHTWKYNKRDYFKRNIKIGISPYWRCWSQITIRPEMIGEWQVIVTDTVGNYLDAIEFSIIPTSE